MSQLESPPAIVVGIDGSKSATHAALWAIDEAVSRDIPLRLVSVIDPVNPNNGGTIDWAAHCGLFDANRAVEATGKPVKTETEILWGKPLDKLMQESRSAVMICIGSMGLHHARVGTGSVAGTLAGSSLCPVAVIHRSAEGAATGQIGRVVAEVDNDAVLRQAFEEAQLRGVPLRAVSVQGPHTAGLLDNENRLAQVQLDRRLARWNVRYPDVNVESAIVRGHSCRYMADYATRDQLFVTDSRAAQACCVYNAGSSVLTVRATNL